MPQGRFEEEMVPEEGVEPTRPRRAADFESAASASSATPGLDCKLLERNIFLAFCLFVDFRRVHDVEVACGGFSFFCCIILSVYIRPD